MMKDRTQREVQRAVPAIHHIWASFALCLAVGTPMAGHAFMTWNSFSKGHGEHERITRLAIACNSALQRPAASGLSWARDLCLESNSSSDGSHQSELVLRMLAGADGYFGGVGAPDRFYEAVISSYDAAHCDNGDAWFPADRWPDNGGVYPRDRDQRTGALRNCLQLLQLYVRTAVEQAGRLVNPDGTVNAAQTDLSEDCNVDYDPKLNPGQTHDRGQAKCNALIAFGRALHITQDFFSHSNWVDATDDPVGPSNAPGLRNSAVPISLPGILAYPRSDAQIDAFLASSPVITGAYPTPSCPQLKPECELPPMRLFHDHGLNKDEGKDEIDWSTASIPRGDGGHSRRASAGMVRGEDNFQRAARSAALSSAALWTDFRAAILQAYPGSRGEMIWAAIRGRTPWTACRQDGDARRSMSPPNGQNSARRTVRIRVTNSMGDPLGCGEARLDSGEWSSLPPDQIKPGGNAEFLVLSNGGDVDGTLQLGGVLFRFFNPLIGPNTFSCTTPGHPELSCSLSGGKGNDAVVDLNVTRTAAGAATNRGGSLQVAVPGRSALGIHKAGAVLPTDRAYRPTLASLNPPLSQQDQLRLQQKAPTLQVCSGRAAQVQLKVSNISCTSALDQLVTIGKSGQKKRCPLGWTVLADPRLNGAPSGAILCHQRTGAINDQRAVKVLVYALPH